VCHPSANWTSETEPWSMDVSHSMLIVRSTVGPTARFRPRAPPTDESSHLVRAALGLRALVGQRRHAALG
jgi:hypothetical protein